MLLAQLQDACERLKEVKFTGGKRGPDLKQANEILEFLEDEELCRLLANNSLWSEKERFNWTSVFNAVEDFFMKVAEKLNVGLKLPKNGTALLFALVNGVVQKATLSSDFPSLSWLKLYDFIFNCFDHRIISELYGFSLAKMLRDFLSVELYASLITGDKWNEIIEKLLPMIDNVETIPDDLILECLNVAIAYASDCTSSLPILRTEVVNFYSFSFRNGRPKQNIALYLKGLTILCQKNALEFRGILCKLGEEVILNILLNMSGSVESEQIALVEFLLVQMGLHMPLNVSSESDAFYAYDQSVWNETVRAIHSFCLEDIEDVATKKFIHFRKDAQIADAQLLLVAKTTKQIIDGQLDKFDNMDADPRSKKLMRHKSFTQILNDISEMNPDEGLMVWLVYLSAVMNEFPSLITPTVSLASFLKLGLNALNSPFVGRPEIYKFLQSVLLVEKYHMEKGYIKKHTTVWENIWDILIKYISVSETKSYVIHLISLIFHQIKPQNVNSLLLLYINQSLTVNKDTLQLLADYLTVCSFPVFIPCDSLQKSDVTNCPRTAILNWLFKSSPEPVDWMLGNEPLVSTIVCSLFVKQSYTLAQSEGIKSNHKLKRAFTTTVDLQFEKTLLQYCFINPTEETLHSHENGIFSAREKNAPFTVIEEVLQKLIHYLKQLNNVPTSIDYANVLRLQTRVSLMINILNLFNKYDLSEKNISYKSEIEKVTEFFLVTKFGKMFVEFLSHVRLNEKNPRDVWELLKKMKSLFYVLNFTEDTKTWFYQRFPATVIDGLKRILRSSLKKYWIERERGNSDQILFYYGEYLNRYYSNAFNKHPLSSDELSDPYLCKLASFEALCRLIEFSVINDRGHDLLLELHNDLNSAGGQFHSGNEFLFEMCSEMIERLCHMPDFLDNIIAALQPICKAFYKVPKCFHRIWKLLSDVLELASKGNEIQKRNFITLIGTMSTTGLLKCSAGTTPEHIGHVATAFTGWNVLAQYDRNLSWSVKSKMAGEAEKVILLDTYVYLDSPSNKLRHHAVELIHRIFKFGAPSLTHGQSSPTTTTPWSPSKDVAMSNLPMTDRREELFEKLYQKIVHDSFNIPVNLTPEEKMEEGVNRTASALACITNLIFAYPYTQKKAIMSLFVLQTSKNICVELADRALKYAHPSASKIMLSNASFILGKWFKLEYALKDFPYQFFDCNSLEAFCLKYQSEITVAYFHLNRQDLMTQFAQMMNIPNVLELTKKCYGVLMAHLTPGLTFKDKPHIAPFGPSEKKRLEISWNHFITILGGQSSAEAMMVNHLGDVIINLISIIHDPKIISLWGCPEVKLPEPEKVHFEESVITECINFLSQNGTIVGTLIQTNCAQIYNIFMTLLNRIYEAHDIYERFIRLHHFSFLVELISDEPDNIFDGIKEFFCHFVTHAYLRLLKFKSPYEEEAKTNCFYRAVLHLIYKWVERLHNSNRVSEMIIYYNTVITGLVSFVVEHLSLAEAAKKPMDFLLKTFHVVYKLCIRSLDPFPKQIHAFHDYRTIHADLKYDRTRNEWPLEKDLQTSLDELNSNSNSKSKCSKERLELICGLLSEKKRELDILVKRMEGKFFSEDCSQEIIYNLLQTLLEIAMNPTEKEEIVFTACRCLGEIGPVDLSALVFCPSRNRSKIVSMINAISSIIELVADYFTSEDMNVVTTTGEVLKNVFEVKECNDMADGEIETSNPRLSKILRPFKCTNPTASSIGKVQANVLRSKLESTELCEQSDYKTWIIQLTCGLIECVKPNESFLCRLLPLCRLKVEFCEEILPFVFFVILYAGRANPIVRHTVTLFVKDFFNKFCQQQQLNSMDGNRNTPMLVAGNQSVIYLNKMALRALLRVVQFLRIHTAPEDIKGNAPLTPWDNNFWIDINYLEAARAAQYCGAYLTSILFIEIYAVDCEAKGSSPMDESEDDSIDQFYSQGNTAYPRNKGDASSMEKLLLKAYSNIGESDAVYGCGSARFSDPQSNIQHLIQQKSWGRVLAATDSNEANNVGVGFGLKQLDLCHTLWLYLKGIESTNKVINQELSEIQYECGWRLSKWNLNQDRTTYVTQDPVFDKGAGCSTFHKFIYEGIVAGLSNDEVSLNESIKRCTKGIVQDLKHASLESTERLYEFLSRFQMVRIVEDFFDCQREKHTDETRLDRNQTFEDVLYKWKLQDKINCSDFKFQEAPLYLRSVLTNSVLGKPSTAHLEHTYDESMLHLVSKARDNNRLELAENCTRNISAEKSARKEIEIAKNYWHRGDRDIARHMLGKLLKKSSPDTTEVYPSVLLLYGKWLSESMSERPSAIIDKYLQRSCQIYEKKKEFGYSQYEIAKANFVLAKYADQQYQNVASYMKSESYQEKIRHYETAKSELEQNNRSTDVDTRKSAHCLRRHTNIDQEEIQSTMAEKQKFLELALKHYMRGLSASNDHDLLIFRAVALWLENDGDDDNAAKVNKIVAEEKMPSYKYIVVLHQLSARLTLTTKGKPDLLQKILVQCAKQHPYHALPVLLTQALLHKDKEMAKTGGSSRKQLVEDRVKAAAKLIDSFKKDTKNNKPLAELTMKMEKLWIALISLANVPDSKNTDGLKKSIPQSAPLLKLGDMKSVAVPTTTVPVIPSGVYNSNNNPSFVGIEYFEDLYSLVGGINSPKRISCRGSNGLQYNMLLKGHDDLRQDAVMQQVFGVMNKLLAAEPKTKSKKLNIRTYKVVPLSQISGVLEWCENTQTFGDYLVGSDAVPGAHVVYRPNDIMPSDCRRRLMEARDCGDNDRKLATYMNIMEHFKPVFRHFFFEKFKEPGTFFERRLAYTRSVATNSMVGYILGLGDRHVLNILVDKATAELIHIDLGVAFEQGRILPTPETIPFRLTRDIVDGMGISGIEGTFRRSCEMTLEVLRNNSEIILTILEVLLYDPLYMWTLTADMMKKVQPADSVRALKKSFAGVSDTEDVTKARNNSAARVLLRLKQKLRGVEEVGTAGSSLSVPGHVSLLIQQAMDPEKLCRLFPGWQPYL